MPVIFYHGDNNKRAKVSGRRETGTRGCVYENFNTNYLYIKDVKKKSCREKSF